MEVNSGIPRSTGVPATPLVTVENLQATDKSVIPESTESTATTTNITVTESLPLPSISMLLSKECSIPLICCDYSKTLESVTMYTNQEESRSVAETGNQCEMRERPVNINICTSDHKRTVIDYKKF